MVVLTAISKADQPMVSASAVSAMTKLPEPTVAKVLKALAKADIVTSVRGANGGYKLASLPQDISIASVIVAIDGPIALTSCVEHGEVECGLANSCPSLGRWDRVNKAIEETLEEIKLSDMVRPNYDFVAYKETAQTDNKEGLKA